MKQKETLSQAELNEARRSTALHNVQTFGIHLPKRCFLNGKLTNRTVNRLEYLVPGFTTMFCISPSIIGIGFISDSLINFKKIQGTTISKRVRAFC